MTEDNINDLYLDYLSHLIYAGTTLVNPYITYGRMLNQLNAMDFQYIIDRDANRYSDGIELRYQFGHENNIPQPVIASVLDVKPCSVLEMMVALAKRCDNFMQDSVSGSRTGVWFWTMIDTLGLKPFTDQVYEYDAANCPSQVEQIISRFMNRQYDSYTGEGSLFPNVKNDPNYAGVEIWYQANWYLSNIIMNT